MTDRLSPLDVSFLYLESETTPMHVGGVVILERPPEGFDYDGLVQLITDRISTIPRFRQKVKWVPGRLGNPVWVDDPDFDVSYHVRRSALPKPGSEEQLKELTARVQSRRLDRRRPLWEIYVVEGLADGRIAIITKTHHAMVDGVAAVDVGAVILDLTREPRETPRQQWTPQPEPSSVALVTDAVTSAVRKPAELVSTLRANTTDVRRLAGRVAATASGLAAAARTTARAAPDSPLNVEIGEQRRFAMARTDLDDYKRVRKEHGGTVNDVVLATVAGALRTWLLTRGESVTGRVVRAMVPVSVRADGQQLGNRVSSYFVDLPVGEPSPVVRLSQVSYAMTAHKQSGQSVGAQSLVGLAGFVAPTLHAMGARVASSFTSRLFNVVVTNVPGPQIPLYAAGAEVLEVFPVVPIAKGQAVSIGLTSYNGGVFYGLNCDRDAMPDADVLAQCIEEALADLVETVA
ncbi:MAG TPA: wax ester/triacylglycerol synthase family O-acyltransferase [Frankiaceae bacterium]|nr:wax ester/triacylglycerol synthase family O-acyltransferase [Frankiaceae bacterium]